MKGCTRTWHCLRDQGYPFVMHILKEHVEHIEIFNGDEAALFPTADRSLCAKQGVVDTISRAVDISGGSAKDTNGNWRISGGTRTFCNCSLGPITIQLIGRWGSMAVLSYLAEAPLEEFHHRLLAMHPWHG